MLRNPGDKENNEKNVTFCISGVRIIDDYQIPTTPAAKASAEPGDNYVQIVSDPVPINAQVTVDVAVSSSPKSTQSLPAGRPMTSASSSTSSIKSRIGHSDPNVNYSLLYKRIRSSSSIEEEGIKINLGPAEQIPVKHRQMKQSDLELTESVRSKSYHEIKKFYKSTSSGKQLRYFKPNPKDSFMSELEALAIGFFRLIAPSHFPSASAHFNENRQYIGVSSKAVPEYKSLKEDPLTEEDLNNPEYVKNIAIITTTSHVFEENDLHGRNLSKKKRIDGDELLFPILAPFKEKDKTIIKRTCDTLLILIQGSGQTDNSKFKITEKDILSAPIFTDYQPRYWPGNKAPVVEQSLSSNAYTEEEIKRFAKLSTDKTFIYHKYKTYLKFCLTSRDMYECIAEMHLRKNILVNDCTLINYIVDHIDTRLNEVRNTLIKMKDFQRFMREDGCKAINEIMDEFKAANTKLSSKLKQQPNYINRIVNIEEIRLRYQSMLEKVRGPENANDGQDAGYASSFMGVWRSLMKR